MHVLENRFHGVFRLDSEFVGLRAALAVSYEFVAVALNVGVVLESREPCLVCRRDVEKVPYTAVEYVVTDYEVDELVSVIPRLYVNLAVAVGTSRAETVAWHGGECCSR